MPDESCRMCGGKLAKCTVCAECRRAVSMICIECGTRTHEQVHALCFLSNLPQIEDINWSPSGIFSKQTAAIGLAAVGCDVNLSQSQAA